MSIQNEITRITTSVANTYAVLESYGATMPDVQDSNNLAATAASVPSVRYTEQALTEEQKVQVRDNIDAFGFKRVLTSADDLNNLTELGFYRYSKSSVPANSPYSDNDCIVEIIETDIGKLQRVTAYDGGGRTKQRVKSSTWGSWTQVPLVLSKTYTGTTNANGNVNTSIDCSAFRILSISAADASGAENYLINLYKSTASGGRWYANITSVSSKANVANTEFTLTIYYMVA